MEYVIGFDGGGTKTELVAVNLSGGKLIAYIGGAANPKAVSFETAMLHIIEMLDRLHVDEAYDPQLCRSICLGMAGVYLEEEKTKANEYLTRYYASQGLQRPLINITNDAEIALMAALGDNNGIIAIAGTGSIVYGLTPSGRSYRTGGWGHLLGDFGSGYDIGLQVLQAVMLSFDGVLPATRLTELILDKYRMNSPVELREYVYGSHIEKKHIAEFAELCIDAAETSDRTAVAIITKAASDLAKLTAAMLRKDNWFNGSSIAVTGSIFQYSLLFRETYRERMESIVDNPKIVRSQQSPAYGAALLGIRKWNAHAAQ
jgi:N-acetylglucosamine kinase-like BadF-type ATPase